MENRNYIIDRLKSRLVSIDEFNYDRLQAPPISCMFTPQDIAQLNMIAKSIRYSAKPQVKYQEIDKIMRSRGFEKFIAGTNRVVYRPLEDNTFVVKVAADAVGLGDNPREFRNQFIFKPFITKVFEITPCGTLGVFERVVPITSREEFLSVASDIFEVINSWFIGEYVLEDIGTNFFMNWGIRKGFGPVLLDFPYVYKLDGNKLFCNAPSLESPSGHCEGVIDYDPGYNFLYCTKCGVKYKAKELSKSVEENKIIVKSEGEFKMKVSIKGGTKRVSKEITTGQYSGMAKSINKKSSKVEVIRSTKKSKEPEKKEVISPIEFDETLKKEPKMNKIRLFNIALENAISILEEANEDDRKEMCNILAEAFADEIEEAAHKVLHNQSKGCECSEKDMPELPKRIINCIIKSSQLFSELSVDGGALHIMEEYLDNEKKEEFLENISTNFVKFLLNAIIGERFYLHAEHSGLYYSEENEATIHEIYPGIATDDINGEIDWIIIDREGTKFGFRTEQLKDILSGIPKESSCYGSCKFFAAAVININELIEEEQSGKVIVLIDEDGNYLTIGENNDIIVVDLIDNRSVSSLSIVSADWLNNIMKERGVTEEEQQPDSSTVSREDIPTGVLAPTMTVNGVAESDDDTDDDNSEK